MNSRSRARFDGIVGWRIWFTVRFRREIGEVDYLDLIHVLMFFVCMCRFVLAEIFLEGSLVIVAMIVEFSS